MSDTAWAESFLSRFVLPLVVGDEAHVAAPLGRRGALRLREAIGHKLDDTEVGTALQEARWKSLHQLGFAGAAPRLLDDIAACSLLVALHDLLFLLHPEAVRLRLESRVAVLRAALQLGQLAAIDADDTELEILYGRHSLLGPLWQLGRDDVRRQTRRGAQVYKGQKAPRRWLSSDDDDDDVQRIAVLPELLSLPKELGRDVARALFCASPLSDLWHPLRESPSPALDPCLHSDWLRRPQLARLLVRRYCELGLFAVGAKLATALLARLELPSASPTLDAEVTVWLCFVAHLHLVAHVLGDAVLPAGSASPAVIDFYALYAALHQSRRELTLPADVLHDPPLRKAAARHAERCFALAGPSRVSKLSTLLGKPHVQAA